MPGSHVPRGCYAAESVSQSATTLQKSKVSDNAVSHLLVSGIFLDEVQILPPNDQRPMHLRRHHRPSQDPASDRHHPRERTLLVDIGPLDSRLGRLEVQPNVLVPSPALLARLPALGCFGFGVEEDVGLLLEGALGLNRQLGRHDCGCLGRGFWRVRESAEWLMATATW